MAATVSTPTTLTKNLNPRWDHVTLSALLAIAPENMTRKQAHQLHELFNYIPDAPTKTLIQSLAGYI